MASLLKCTPHPYYQHMTFDYKTNYSAIALAFMGIAYHRYLAYVVRSLALWLCRLSWRWYASRLKG